MTNLYHLVEKTKNKTPHNKNLVPGAVARFNSGYHHWGILSDTIGRDGLPQIISVYMFKEHVFVDDFSKIQNGRQYIIEGDQKPLSDRKDICRKAKMSIGTEANYNILLNNCEHYVKKITSQKKQSGQSSLFIAASIVGYCLYNDKAPKAKPIAIIVGLLVGYLVVASENYACTISPDRTLA